MITAQQLYTFLRSAIRNRGRDDLDQVAAYAAEYRELEIKGPCIAALACWGDEGFKRAIENALQDTTSKNISGAIKLLAAIASGRTIKPESCFIQDEDCLKEINDHVSENDLSTSARRRLSELVMSLSEIDLLIPLGTAFTQAAIVDPGITSEIVSAIGSKWLGFGPRELDVFDALLKESPEDEPSLHNFFEKYPQMLDPMAIQVWSKPDFHGFKEPDFLIRRSDDTYVVIEIENADKTLITQADQPSFFVTQAVKQANEYRNFLAERIVEARHHFPGIHDPDALVIIGLERRLTTTQREALKQENHSRAKLRIVGFDWISERSRAVLSNVTGSKVEVIKRHRVV